MTVMRIASIYNNILCSLAVVYIVWRRVVLITRYSVCVCSTWYLNIMTADCRMVETTHQCTLDLRVYDDDIAHAGIYISDPYKSNLAGFINE